VCESIGKVSFGAPVVLLSSLFYRTRTLKVVSQRRRTNIVNSAVDNFLDLRPGHLYSLDREDL